MPPPAFSDSAFNSSANRIKAIPVSGSTSQADNARLGLRLFFVYSLFYLGFVIVCAFFPSWSGWELVPGLNLAIVWGFALIGLAFLLALVYGVACKAERVGLEESKEQAPR